VAPSTGASAAQDSQALRERMDRDHQVDEKRVRQAGGRSFVLRDGCWTESTLLSAPTEAETLRITALSADWLALARRDPRLRAILALGERVRFLWEGRVVEVVAGE